MFVILSLFHSIDTLSLVRKWFYLGTVRMTLDNAKIHNAKFAYLKAGS